MLADVRLGILERGQYGRRRHGGSGGAAGGLCVSRMAGVAARAGQEAEEVRRSDKRKSV